MSRSLAVLACLLVLGLLPTVAAAKEAIGGRACGAEECVELSAGAAQPVLEGGPEAAAPRRAGAFHEFRVRVRAGDRPEDVVTLRLTFLQEPGLVRTEDGTWMRPDGLAALRELVAGLAPHPASALVAPEIGNAAPPPPAASSEADRDGGPPALVLAAAIAAAVALAATAWRRRAIAPS